MTDEPALKDAPADDWAMPEPVFRRSEGRKPGEPPHDPQGDIPTEPGFTDHVDEPSDAAAKQGVRAKTTEPKERYTVKKRGCLKSFATIVLVLVASLLAILVTAVYLLFFYRPATDGTF